MLSDCDLTTENRELAEVFGIEGLRSRDQELIWQGLVEIARRRKERLKDVVEQVEPDVVVGE